jgi:hypothetical protein
MKKKIIGGIAVLAIAAVAVFNVNLNLAQESNMSSLALANVEALAQETGGGGDCTDPYKLTHNIPNDDCGGTIIYTYSCLSANNGNCRKGKVYVNYDCNNEYGGQRDERTSVSCQ